MTKKILIDANFPEIRVAVLDKNDSLEYIESQIDSNSAAFSGNTRPKQIKGNIYLAKVTRVEPSLQAVFIDYNGGEKSGFLPFSEINSSYYNLPEDDKKTQLAHLREIMPPKITQDDLIETQGSKVGAEIIDSEDIDIEAIQKMVDEKLPSDFDIEVSDDLIEEELIRDKVHEKLKDYKLQDLIKKGQVLLVQAVKEERGNKGASFTTYISLAGKYCVLMPNKGQQNGVSRKISNADERKRLRDILNGLMSEKDGEFSSIIARTAGVGHSTLDIKRDYDYLARLWNRIREAAITSKAPSFVHQEDGILLKTIRDLFDRNTKEIIVQGEVAYNSCLKFMRDMLPNQLDAIKEYKGKVPIFSKYTVEEQISKLYQARVELRSGGYMVINPTEALTAIDINSGKATSERNVEDTALKTNLEAAKEIAKQVKLRDISGLIVIDFIDMGDPKHRKLIERSLREFLRRDRARIQTSNISPFGLLEMSRQRMRHSFLETHSVMCTHCGGKGLVRVEEANAMLILRTLENEIYENSVDVVNVYAASDPILYLLNNKRVEISLIEDKYQIKLNFSVDKDATSDSFSIEKVKLASKNKVEPKVLRPILQDARELYNQTTQENNRSRRKIAIASTKGGHQVSASEIEQVAEKAAAPIPNNNSSKKKVINKATPVKQPEVSKQEEANDKSSEGVVSAEKQQKNKRKRIRKKPSRKNQAPKEEV